MWRGLFLFLCVFFSCLASVEGQEIKVDGSVIDHARSNLNIVIDVIEFRQGDDGLVHLTAGKKHYGLAIVSPRPLPMFDAELPAANPQPHSFTVIIEDGREFSRCLVTGLKSSGADPTHNLSYSLACENVSTPPLPCFSCTQ